MFPFYEVIADVNERTIMFVEISIAYKMTYDTFNDFTISKMYVLINFNIRRVLKRILQVSLLSLPLNIRIARFCI